MKLIHLPLDQLKLSGLNVRKKGGADVADLLPSIRSLGILQPLLVRPNCEGFEIVAGQRRYHALVRLAEEGIAEPVPVAVMEDGDDARAIEASLAEKIARLPMDEIDQYKAFASLKKRGLDAAEIAARFGVTERLVNQRLAIAGIIEPILNAYRREEIRPDTLRCLTMATPRQQKAWWKLFKDEECCAPTGWHLKQWLFGGAQVPLSNAIFELADYKGAIVSDLFGDERYFADADAFWPLQNAAIAQRRDDLVAEGWGEVVVLDIGESFAPWSHVKTAKTKGGKAFIAVTHDGEVSVHEGWLTEKEAKALAKRAKAEQAGAGGDAPSPAAGRPELTNAMRNYLGLHRHAAVRTELLAHPSIALRLSVAHIVAGSTLWRVEADPQQAASEAIRESLASSEAEQGFAEERRRIRLLLGLTDDEDDENDGESVVPRQRGWRARRDLAGIFERLIHMEDNTVLRILAYLMAETLEAQSGTVEALGAMFATDMKNWWKPDAVFFDLLRDKQAVNAILREVAGEVTADAHTASTAKVQKKIVADCLTGENGRAKVEGWLPRYMAFPASGYNGRFVGDTPATTIDDGGDDGGFAGDDFDVGDDIDAAA